ncbi:MAG: exosortase system-associated protein, TIGR04073 family [Lentisphaeria bacterium]|jgi:putative exosortase-associated protein (TIGR04073 family)
MSRLVVGLALASAAAWAQQEGGAAAAAKPEVTVRPEEVPVNRQPVRQLGRGLSNVLTGVWEVPYNMYKIGQEDGDVAGITYGLVRGIQRFVTREAVGVFEVVTFPAGWGPIIEPEFPFQPTQTTEWEVKGLHHVQP